VPKLVRATAPYNKGQLGGVLWFNSLFYRSVAGSTSVNHFAKSLR
jgi:hypothetical protein